MSGLRHRTMRATEKTLDRLYALVANEEDARACTEISEDACRVVPGNFFLILSSLVLTKIGATHARNSPSSSAFQFTSRGYLRCPPSRVPHQADATSRVDRTRIRFPR